MLYKYFKFLRQNNFLQHNKMLAVCTLAWAMLLETLVIAFDELPKGQVVRTNSWIAVRLQPVTQT